MQVRWTKAMQQSLDKLMQNLQKHKRLIQRKADTGEQPSQEQPG